MSNFELPKMPEFKATKSGYEIRSDVLAMAKDLVDQEYSYKWQGWELSQKSDKDGNIVTKVNMPEVPGLEQVLETAERMYAFVSAGATNTNFKSKK